MSVRITCINKQGGYHDENESVFDKVSRATMLISIFLSNTF